MSLPVHVRPEAAQDLEDAARLIGHLHDLVEQDRHHIVLQQAFPVLALVDDAVYRNRGYFSSLLVQKSF